MRQRLTLVVPMYRESKRVEGSLDAIAEFIAETSEVEVDAIMVNDGSPDNTAELVEGWLGRHPGVAVKLMGYERNQGKGYAVKVGMLAAKGDIVLMSDTDLSTPLSDWRVLYDQIRGGAEVACGSRAVAGAHIGKPPPWYRRILSRVFNLLVRAAGVKGVRDTQCGFKMFTAEASQAIFSRLETRRFAFDVEMIALARDLGFKLVEVPVNWYYSEHSTVRLFSSGSRMVWDIARLAVRRMWGKVVG